MPDMIEIDGSHGEGGGQVIRTALTLSAITKKPVRISKIRANRPNPGLQMQHLTAAKAVRSMCRGTLEGAELHSTELVFNPGEIFGGKYEFNIGTAGSVTLVAQTLLPIALQAPKPSTIRIIGGTHVIKSPGYDYFEQVFLPAIRHTGADVSSSLIKCGYYPHGGGEIEVNAEPGRLKGETSWLSDSEISVLIRLSNLPRSIGIREKKIFVQEGMEKVRVMEENAIDPGNAVLAWAGFRGAYVPGEKSKRAEAVAKEALDELVSSLRFEVDRHLADQLLVYAALAEGETRFTMPAVTEHLRTNASVILRFLDRTIEIDEKNEKAPFVSIR